MLKVSRDLYRNSGFPWQFFHFIVNIVLNVHTNHKVFIRDGEKGGRGYGGCVDGGGGGGEIIYLSLHCHHQNDLCILIFHNCEGQSHKTVSTDHNFWRERRAEADSNQGPSAYHPNAHH